MYGIDLGLSLFFKSSVVYSWGSENSSASLELGLLASLFLLEGRLVLFTDSFCYVQGCCQRVIGV